MAYARRRLSILAIFLVLVGALVFVLWFGVNSDKDNIHPLLTQLIPAGHCTCESSTTFNCTSCSKAIAPVTLRPSDPVWKFQYGKDGQNVNLDSAQCRASFPGLFEDVDRAVAFWKSHGNVSTHNLDNVTLRRGMARAMIHDQELYVVASQAAQEDHRRKILAVLSSIHRALAAGHATPNIEFIFSVEDKVEDIAGPGHPLWVLARKATEESVWLMPDFGFWAWDNLSNSIGPYNQVVRNAKRLEENLPWSLKIKKVVWRGKLSFAPKLRRALLQIARDQPWGDVKELVWSRKDNFIGMEDHCKYQFIAHVEGRAFSSSLKYRQACRSVIIVHKLHYIQHHHYLLQAEGPEQNYVEVERDFADLPEKINILLADTALAERIANNSVKTFRERYLTKAAEACYWRELWDGWAKVASEDGKFERKGLRYESFILLESKAMMMFPPIAKGSVHSLRSLLIKSEKTCPIYG
ncbi:hypothetical protein LOZ51_000842 [Ophidiomyces ophidiicola]|nr:hypothetical protein LOZ55_000521 [Ophidiomyces ophidiicola]KAI1996726.1 hypothetical protein LOZ54_000098 [Ophidiomyces ophidiicola]KAI2003759.1 hypothetical protein LOZ51_000842 [Ophidiomyces ophidiicola]